MEITKKQLELHKKAEKKVLEFQKSNYKTNNYQDFIKNYEVELMIRIEKERIHYDFIGKDIEEIDLKELEISFLKELFEYQSRKNDVLMRYLDHRQEMKKYKYENEIDIFIINQLLSHNYISHFIEYKLLKLGVKIKEVKHNRLHNIRTSGVKKKTKNTLNGETLNLLDRYEIMNKMFNIDNSIRKLNVSDTDKYKLLSLILDCNTTNARQIMNGNYGVKLNEKLVNNYIENLKK